MKVKTYMRKLLPHFHGILLIVLLAGLSVPAQPGASQNVNLLVIYRNGKAGYADTNGKIVIPPRFDVAQRTFVEGLAIVGVDKKYGFIDMKGKEIGSISFDEVEPFSEGLAAVKLNSIWGFIDKNGKMVIPPTYTSADKFSEGLARVGLRKKESRSIDNKDGFEEFGYIDKAGKEVIPVQYYEGSNFERGVAIVFEPVFNSYIYIDPKGKPIIPFEDKSFDPNTTFYEAGVKGPRAGYPKVQELRCESNPSGAEVFLIPKLDWEDDPGLRYDDPKLEKYRIPSGNTPAKVNVKEKKFIALFIKHGIRKWVEVDIPTDTLAKVEF
jgi:hypothetical protein